MLQITSEQVLWFFFTVWLAVLFWPKLGGAVSVALRCHSAGMAEFYVYLWDGIKAYLLNWKEGRV